MKEVKQPEEHSGGRIPSKTTEQFQHVDFTGDLPVGMGVDPWKTSPSPYIWITVENLTALHAANTMVVH